jgi:sialate O-acetylesterase
MKNCNSYLWNAMINPLKRVQLKGFLWYQGESNGGYNRKQP